MYYLSIITVAYNNKEGLIRTRDSILPLPDNCEWIIIDAASSDGTKKILESLPKQKNIKWISESDKGIFDGMNKGIDLAKGKYLNFMNSGDFYNRSTFENISRNEPDDADVIMYNCMTVDENNNQGYARQFPKSIDELKEWACVQHQSTLLHYNVFKKLGKYNLSYRYLSDYEHSVKAYLDKSISFSLNNNVKLAYFLQDGVSTNLKTVSKVSEEYISIQKKYFGSFSKKLYMIHLAKILIGYLPKSEFIGNMLRKIILNKR